MFALVENLWFVFPYSCPMLFARIVPIATRLGWMNTARLIFSFKAFFIGAGF